MAAVMDSDKNPLPGSSKMKQLEEVCPWEVENVCPWDFQKKEEAPPAPTGPASLSQQSTKATPNTAGRISLKSEPSKSKGPERGVPQGVPEDMARTAGAAAKVDQAVNKLRIKKHDTDSSSARASGNIPRKDHEKSPPTASADPEIAPWETQTNPTEKVVVETQKLGTGGKVAEIAPWEVEGSLPEAAVAVTVQKLGKSNTSADIVPWEDPTVGGSDDKVEITVQRLITVEEVTPWEVGAPGNLAGGVEINVQSLKEFVDPEVAAANRRGSTDTNNKSRRTSTQPNTLEKKDTSKEKEQRRSSQGLLDSNRRGSLSDVFGRRKSHDSKGEKSPLHSNIVGVGHEGATKVESQADAEISPWEYQSKADISPVQIKKEAIGQARQVEEVTPWEMPTAKPGLATVQVEVIGGKSDNAEDDVCPWEMTAPVPTASPAANQVHPTQSHGGSGHHGHKIFGKKK